MMSYQWHLFYLAILTIPISVRCRPAPYEIRSLALEDERNLKNEFEYIFTSSALSHPYESLPRKSQSVLKKGLLKGGRFNGRAKCEVQLEVEVIKFKQNRTVLCLFQEQWQDEDNDVTKGAVVDISGETYEGSEKLQELVQPVTGYVLGEAHSTLSGYIINSAFYGQVRVWEKVANMLLVYNIEPWENVLLYDLWEHIGSLEEKHQNISEDSNAIVFEYIAHSEKKRNQLGEEMEPTPKVVHSTTPVTTHPTWYKSTKGQTVKRTVVHSTPPPFTKGSPVHSTTQATKMGRTFFRSTKGDKVTPTPVMKSTKGVSSEPRTKWFKSTKGVSLRPMTTKRMWSTTQKGKDEEEEGSKEEGPVRSTTVKNDKDESEDKPPLRSTTHPLKKDEMMRSTPREGANKNDREVTKFRSTHKPGKAAVDREPPKVIRSTEKPKGKGKEGKPGKDEDVIRSTHKPDKKKKDGEDGNSFQSSTEKGVAKDKDKSVYKSSKKPPVPTERKGFMRSTKNMEPRPTKRTTPVPTEAPEPEKEEEQEEESKPEGEPEPDPEGDFQTVRMPFSEVTSGFTFRPAKTGSTKHYLSTPVPRSKKRRRRKRFAEEEDEVEVEEGISMTTPMQVPEVDFGDTATKPMTPLRANKKVRGKRELPGNELDEGDFGDDNPKVLTKTQMEVPRMRRNEPSEGEGESSTAKSNFNIDDNDILEEISYSGFGRLGSVEVFNLVRRKGAYICHLCIWVDPEFALNYGFQSSTLKYGVAEVIDLVRWADWIFRGMDFNMDFIPENVGFGLRELHVKELEDLNELIEDEEDWKNNPEKIVTTLEGLVKPLFKGPCCVFVAFIYKSISHYGSVTYRRGMCIEDKNFAVIPGLLHKHKVAKFDIYRFFMHAIGHLLGALNDDESDPDCNDEEPSLYFNPFIMHPAHMINVGFRRNSMRFSFCSRLKIAAFLSSPFAGCLQEKEGAFCGNGVVELGEECDCGGPWQCMYHSHPCCGIRDGFSPCKVVEMIPSRGCSTPTVMDRDLES